MAFGVWLSLVTSRPLSHSVLYLHKLLPEAVPKYISGRTSYFRVRLAFHPYPQLIPTLCHVYGFGPPTACRHKVSGTISLPFRGSFHLSLTVLVHYRSSVVFSLGVWSPQLPTGFHVSRGTQEYKQRLFPLIYGTL